MKKLIAAVVLANSCLSLCAAETYRELPVFEWDPGSEWRNVKDFGAVGDGKADDTAALQKAFEDLANGTVVYLPAGEYKITEMLRWRGKKGRLTNTAVIGCGEATKIVWGGPAGGRMIQDSGLSLARYFGFVLDGRHQATVGLWNDQMWKFETQCRYSYLAFRNIDPRRGGVGLLSENNAMDGQSDSEPTFENCIFENCGTGVSFTSFNDYDFAFRGCLFIHCHQRALFCNRGNFYASACRFEENGVDFESGSSPEHSCSIRRSVSVGSRKFVKGTSGTSALSVENCTIADWKDDVCFDWRGPVLAFNNTFLPGEKKTIYPDRQFTKYIQGVVQGVTTEAKGSRPALALAKDRNFLKKAVRYPRKCFDVIRDFGAKGDGKADDTAAVRAAIAAAKAAGHDAIAYLPSGHNYRITETLVIDGGGYMFGGAGAASMIIWDGDRSKNAIEVVDPQDLVLWQVRVDCKDTFTNQAAKWNGEKGANICQKKVETVGRGREGEVGRGREGTRVTYYGVFCYGKYQGRGMAERQGFHFKDLGANDIVSMPYAEGNLRYENCGDATILCGVAHEGSITVDGPTGTGLLGGCARLSTHCAAPLQVRKNGSFVWSDYYLEQGYDTLVALAGGDDWPAGRVTVGFPKISRDANAAEKAEQPDPKGGWKMRYFKADDYKGAFDIATAQFHPVYARKNLAYAEGRAPNLTINLAAPVYYQFRFGADPEVKVNQVGVSRDEKPFGGADDGFLAGMFDDLTRLGEVDLKLNFAE